MGRVPTRRRSLLAVAAAVTLLVAPAASESRTGTTKPTGGRLIAFTGTPSGSDRAGIFTVRSDRIATRRLTKPDLWVHPGQPTWSPGGTWIAFSGSDHPQGHDYDLWSIRPDGTGLRRLAKVPGSPQDPDWSPEGGRLTFSSGDDIYTVGSDGRGLRRLTRGPAVDNDPDWSPDGRTIAFGSNRGGVFQIWVMDADGDRPRRLVAKRSGEPDWSPTGDRIAYASARDGDPDIYVALADGRGERALTRTGSEDWPPSWSPDGRSIAIGSDRSGQFEIWVMNADGSSQRRLTRSGRDGVAMYPAWQPARG